MKIKIKERFYFKWINLWPLSDKLDGTIHFQFRLSWSLNQVLSIYFLFANLGFNFIFFKKNIESISTIDSNDDLWYV